MSDKTTKHTTVNAVEVSIAQGEERFHLLVNGIKEYAIMILDAKGRVTDWNRGGEHLLGYTEQEIIGKNFSRFFTLEDRKLGKPIIELQVALNEGRAEDENWLVRKDKSRFWASGLSVPLKDKADNFLGFAKIVRDLTDRKELDQQQQDFISLASHELKTPLTGIKGYTQLLKRRLTQTKDSKALAHIDKLEDLINRQETLIRDLLDVAKLQARGISRSGTVIEIDGLVQHIVQELQPTTPTHELIVEGSTGKKVVGDDHQLGQVLLNLLTNAIKYSPQANKIIINLSADQKNVTVSVQDFGIGVPKKHQKRVFDRFFRADNAHEKHIAGYGLGLYIASQIIDQHKGTLGMKSTVGKGSTFYFSLPFVETETLSAGSDVVG